MDIKRVKDTYKKYHIVIKRKKEKDILPIYVCIQKSKPFKNFD